MRNIRPAQVAVLALGIVSALSAHAQLVTNGDFETGDLTGWTSNSALDNDPWAVISGISGDGGSYHGAYSGTYFASSGCVGTSCIGSDTSSNTNYMYEDLNTVANATYTVSFAFASGGANEGDGPPEGSQASSQEVASFEELLATFGGVTVVDLVDVVNTDYVFFSENIVASGTTTRLEFQNREDPGWSALDDISVTQVTATPEPGTILLGLGAALLFLIHFQFSLIHFQFRKTHSGSARTES